MVKWSNENSYQLERISLLGGIVFNVFVFIDLLIKKFASVFGLAITTSSTSPNTFAVAACADDWVYEHPSLSVVTLIFNLDIHCGLQ